MESSSNNRQDRKIVEKNRRVRMKMLYSQLHSLVPVPCAPRERIKSLSLPDQLDETVDYIKGLQANIERMKEKKSQLLGSHEAPRSSAPAGASSSTALPQIEVQELGMGLQVMITSRAGDGSVFKEAIRIIVEEGFEIANANFSVVAGRAFHVIHLQVGEVGSGQGGPKLLERLKKEIHLLF